MFCNRIRLCLHPHKFYSKQISWCILKCHKQKNHPSTINSMRHASNQSSMNVFDREAKKLQKERAALATDAENFDYIKAEVGDRLSDRVYDIKKEFSKVLDLGCGRSHVSKQISSDNVKELICTDISDIITSKSQCDDPAVKVQKIVADEEGLVSAFGPDSIDLVISNLSLHWVNNLPLCFDQIMKVLRNDGVFLASIFGGDTLYELRSSLQLAELERLGGLAPHISPFAQIRDIGSLLTRSGFTMQTIDTEEMVVWYPSMVDLMLDVKGMGENNAAWNRKLNLRRDIITAASTIYTQLYGKELDGRFGVPATYQIIYLLGWKPDPSQPKPLGRGTGEISLKDLHKLEEIVKQKGVIELDEK